MRTLGFLFALSIVAATALPASAGLGRDGEDTFKCQVTVGGGQTPQPAPNLGLDSSERGVDKQTAYASAGGCQLSPGLADDAVVTDVATEDGCAAYADVAPAIPGAEQELEEGMAVKPGAALWAYCEAGVVQAHNVLEVSYDLAS